MRSPPTTILLCLVSSLFLAGASCGQNGAGTPPTPPAPRGPEAPLAQVPESEADQRGPLDLGGDVLPVPELPEPGEQAAPERTPPRIDDLDGAEDALGRGFYAEAEAALPRFTKGRTEGRALLALARLQLETGRYPEAAATAQRAGRDRAVRLPAETLRGEAQWEQGQLDEAERTLTSLAQEADAHRARVLLGRLLVERGRPVEARAHFMALIDAYNDSRIGDADAEGLAYVAYAAWGLDSHQDANDAFQQSTRADDERVETQIEWARLFFDKYDTGHAEESVLAALAVNPHSAVAHALYARIKIEQSFDFSGAEEEIAKALAVNPNLVMAHVTRAGMELRDLDIAAADRHLDRALEVDGNDLEALSVRAAVRYLADDEAGFARAKQEVFRRNRRFSRMYSIIAGFADWEHRYPEIVEMAREAVTLDPDDAFAHATLGLNLLRMGEEETGLDALREAWRRDRYNVQVYNTLNLYDDVLSREYERFESGPFHFRMHREERPILERYVPRALGGAHRDMVRRYGFTPDGPVHLEMFARQQDFSVRTMGLPNLGVQGVCFGKVVTAISPRGGPFNWGQITWHELAHVFHIQLSSNRVPRWFTEGLAEYETNIARPEWRRELDHELWAALEGDRLPPLRLMNRAFTRARSARDMIAAYYASTRIVTYIVERFTFAKIVEMLRGWGAGRSSEEVVQRALGISIDDLDRDFRAHARRRLASHAGQFSPDLHRYEELPPLRAAAQAAPTDADAQAALAAGLMVHGERDEARQAAERAVAAEATHPLGRFVLARLTEDRAQAEQHLRQILAGGRDGYELRLLLARMAAQREDRGVARRELEAAVALDADRAEAWMGLMQVAETTEDAALRLRVLERLATLDEHDREANAALLELLVAQERWDDVVRFGEMGTFVDPGRAETHRVLAEAYLRADRGRDALYEADSALVLEPEAAGPFHLTRARALMALGRRGPAREAVEEARRVDPSLAAQGQAILGGR